MYLVTGTITFKAETVARGKELLTEITTLGRTEPGIKKYEFFCDPGNDCRVFLFEVWETKDHHHAHFSGEVIQGIVPEFFSLFAEPPEVIYYDAEEESRL
jgi:quinol monooxygenase YgiN